MGLLMAEQSQAHTQKQYYYSPTLKAPIIPQSLEVVEDGAATLAVAGNIFSCTSGTGLTWTALVFGREGTDLQKGCLVIGLTDGRQASLPHS